MQKITILMLLLLIVTSSFAQNKQAEPDSIKILFIGNSYTYYNSSPEVVKALVKEKFPEEVVETQLISLGGMTLKRHWEEQKAVQAIRSGHWDYVVLQEQSKLGRGITIDANHYFGQTDLFFGYARKFDAEIKKAGAKTVFYMTWSRKTEPQNQAILTHAYSTIAEELGAILAPVGMVWDQLRKEEQFELYTRDGSHPSAIGSYVVATTLFTSIFEERPIGLSGNISGRKLSRLGEPTSASQLLIDIPKKEARTIQKASWKIVNSLHKMGDYPAVSQPQPTYSLPELPGGDPITPLKLAGPWYGTSTYGFNYLGLILEADTTADSLRVNLSFYSPVQEDPMTVQSARISADQLHLTLFDSLRSMGSDLRLSLKDGQITGISTSTRRNNTIYKSWHLSRKPVYNDVDLTVIDSLMEDFQSNISEMGYVKAALNHYDQYGKLIGKSYRPEEMYLNAEGYNLLREGKINKALDFFELAMTIYPQSINTYDSYGEALIQAGRKEKALKIYTQGYELAKETGYIYLPNIEAKLKQLQEEMK